MRKVKTFYATRGNLTAQGISKTHAKQELDKSIDWALRQSSPIIEYRFGLVIVLASTPNGWQSTIVDPADMVHGERKDSCTCYGQIEYTEALIRARSHAAQWAWSHDVIDDAAFTVDAGLNVEAARNLLSWISFQRNYKILIEQGKTDGEAHELACRMPH